MDKIAKLAILCFGTIFALYTMLPLPYSVFGPSLDLTNESMHEHLCHILCKSIETDTWRRIHPQLLMKF